MAVGKTTYGRALACRLGYNFIDSDQYISDQEGCSVSKIFTLHGEPYFRRLEADFCHKLSLFKQTVISTGGGLIKNEDNAIFLKKESIVIWVTCDIDEVIFRSSQKPKKRPLLKGKTKDEIMQLYNERSPLYKSLADITVDTTDRNVERILAEIESAF